MGQFTTNKLAENGRIIPIIGQISINGSAELLGIPDFSEKVDCCLLKTCKHPICLLAGDTSISPIRTGELAWGGLYINVSVPWVSNVPACPAYIPRSPENPRATARQVRDNFCCMRRCELMRRRSTSCKPVVNLRINSHGDNWEGPVTQ